MSTEAANPQTHDEPSVGGVKVRPQLALALYGLLVVSFAAALWAQRPGAAPEGVARVAPWLFLVFALGFAVYRFALVAARRYSAFKAFFQVGVAFALFFLLLKPVAAPAPGEAKAPAAVSDLSGLLSDPDPRVRALAAELARYRQVGPEVTQALVLRLDDPDPLVRQVAHGTLVQFNSGTDLGSDPKAWKERFP